MGDGTLTVRRQVAQTDAGPAEAPLQVGSQCTVHLPSQGVSALAGHPATRLTAVPTARLSIRRDGTMLRAPHAPATPRHAATSYQPAAERRDAEAAAGPGRLAEGTTPTRTGT